MKKIIVIFVVGCVLFSLSAGASWYLQQKQEQAADMEAPSAHGTLKPGVNVKPFATPHAETTTPSKGSLRPAVRAAAAADTETVAQMASSLRNQLEAVKVREHQLSARQKNLDLIHQDMRREREAITDLQKQVGAEMKALLDRMSTLEGKAVEVSKERAKVSEEVNEAKKSITEFQSAEHTRVKQMAAIYDTMDPQGAAEMFVAMVESGKRDLAVKILSTMRERQSARILSLIPERAVAVDLLDKMKGLKKPASGS